MIEQISIKEGSIEAIHYHYILPTSTQYSRNGKIVQRQLHVVYNWCTSGRVVAQLPQRLKSLFFETF